MTITLLLPKGAGIVDDRIALQRGSLARRELAVAFLIPLLSQQRMQAR
jgi:hypothetical protein